MLSTTKMIAGALAGVLLAAGATQAASPGRAGGSTTITVEEAQRIATERVPGRVEEAELENRGGRVVWEVEIELGNGEDREVIIDARTGEVLSVDD